MTQLDLFVIGTGSAGSAAAYACREAGWTVGIADYRPFGGTCALRGCDPKKVLVAAEEVVERVRRFTDLGVLTGDCRIDWPGLMRFKNTFTAPVPARDDAGFAAAGIARFHGCASFVDVSTVKVGDETVRARNFVIAVGAEPRPLHIEGEELLTTSEQFLDLEHLPDRIVMAGGGYISFEFAHVAARAGASVTIVHQGERPLEQFDADLVDALVAATRELGIEVRLTSRVRRVERRGGSLAVHVEDGAKQRAVIEAAMVVHGAGRAPNLEPLSLPSAGIAATANGVAVDEYLQSTSSPGVYAAGDAADTKEPRLTPVAAADGEIAAANLLRNCSRKATLGSVPSIVFTTPPLGAVGLTEAQARTRGLRFTAKRGDTADWYSSRRLGARRSAYKVLIEDGTDRILGAAVLGPGAEELTNLFTMAMRLDVPASRVRDVVFAYPTFASDIAYMV